MSEVRPIEKESTRLSTRQKIKRNKERKNERVAAEREKDGSEARVCCEDNAFIMGRDRAPIIVMATGSADVATNRDHAGN